MPKQLVLPWAELRALTDLNTQVFPPLHHITQKLFSLQCGGSPSPIKQHWNSWGGPHGNFCNLRSSYVSAVAWNGVALVKNHLFCYRSFRCNWMTRDTWMKIWRSSWQSLTGGTIFSSQSWMSWGLCWTRQSGQGSWQSMNCWKPLNVWTCFTLRLAFSVLSPSLG